MQTFRSNNGLVFTILKKEGKQCTIQFLGTGSVRQANYDNIVAGKVRDVYQPSSYGVGYLGEYKRLPYTAQAQQLWRNMIKRCYFAGDPKGYVAKGTKVDPRWHNFASFLDDLPKLENFNRWLNKEGYQLDKDLRVPGANVYSFHTCSFVTEAENKAEGGRIGGKISRPRVTTSA